MEKKMAIKKKGYGKCLGHVFVGKMTIIKIEEKDKETGETQINHYKIPAGQQSEYAQKMIQDATDAKNKWIEFFYKIGRSWENYPSPVEITSLKIWTKDGVPAPQKPAPKTTPAEPVDDSDDCPF
jgi:hypothetical protein